jgi:hypothetical protein
MVSGFFGSAIAESILVFGLSTINRSGSREELMLTFAVAPLFVFAPVLLVLLSRHFRGRNDRLANEEKRNTADGRTEAQMVIQGTRDAFKLAKERWAKPHAKLSGGTLG